LHDVIVVGGGSAGATAAALLSEDPNRRVLLLEAGRDWRPADAPEALLSPNIIPFMHDPAHQAEWQWPGLTARRTRSQEPKFYWRGRAMGGSSTVNAQIAIRGVGAAFDAWAEAGCEGWAARDVLPVFDAIEDDPANSRTSGTLPVYRAPQEQWGAVDRGLRDAALALGYPWNPDLNDPNAEGVSCYPINSRDHRRVTTHQAFLDPVRGRANLEIVGDALVDRVLLADGRATGVRAHLPAGGWQDFSAREVMLCAGAVHSPAILMRSGIGPAAALGRLGIGVARDLPMVGANFMDHPILRATLHLRRGAVARDRDARHTNCCVTYSSGIAGGGFRDMILIAFNHRGLTDDASPGYTGAIGAALYEAFSRGSVSLASPRPEDNPVVEENMLDDPRDRERLREAVARLAALAEQPALRALADPILFGETLLSPAEAAALPPAELDALLLAEVSDIQHAAGTCRMTAYEDPRGVVDPDLRVKGVGGLRVADASIMPLDCRANLHFTCVMIGARAARFIAAA
jgi:choline dehydrogenase